MLSLADILADMAGRPEAPEELRRAIREALAAPTDRAALDVLAERVIDDCARRHVEGAGVERAA